MSLLSVCMSLALVAYTSAICCIPEKHTAWFHATSYTSGSLYKSEGVQYYDAKRKLVASITKTTLSDGTSSITKVYNNLSTGETFTLTGDHCTRILVPAVVMRADKINCFPANATLGKSLFIGGPHEDLELQQINTPVKDGVIQTTVTKNHCLPVHQYTQIGETKNNKYKTTFVTDVNYVNLVPTINDSSAFVIPDVCLNAILRRW